MDRDYAKEGKRLLLRALEAMVKNIEQCTEVQVSSDSGTRYLASSDFDGEDIVRVYTALVSDPGEPSGGLGDLLESKLADYIARELGE